MAPPKNKIADPTNNTPPKTNESPKVVVEKPKQDPPPMPLAPISLFADTATAVVEPKSLGSTYAPFGRLIPCVCITTEARGSG